MHVIDQQNWPRQGHYQLYRGFEFAHVNITVQIDITELWEKRALVGDSPTLSLVYIVTRAANRLPGSGNASAAKRSSNRFVKYIEEEALDLVRLYA